MLDTSNWVSAVATIICAWFTYNQYTRNKLTDLKLEIYKKETERRNFRRSENTAKVYGELWKVLYETKADRVYIIQPHPLGNSAFLSIQFEVDRKKISAMKENVQELPMAKIAVFSKCMAENLFMYYGNISEDIKDKVARSMFLVKGCHSVAIKRLNNATDWVGSIFCDFPNDGDRDIEHIRKVLHEAAENIQFILPEVMEKMK